MADQPRLLSSLIVAVVLTAPCTDGREPPASGKAVGPCDLLKVEEIRAETGHDVSPGGITDPIGGPPDTMCVYGLSAKFGSLEIFLDRGGADDFSKRFADDDASTISVKGLGDEAYLRGGSSLAIRVGSVYLSLGTQFYHRRAPKFLRRLAAIAIARI